MGHCKKNMISIYLTNVCNLRCKYCYLGDKTGVKKKVIDINFAKRGIEDFINQGNPPAVRFFAEGEPTLAFKEMVELKEYTSAISNNNAIFELQTNGVFNENVAKWISENIDIVHISMDGLPKHHDALRVSKENLGTSKIIEKNIRIIGSNPNIQLSVRATITKKNNSEQKEMLEYFKSIGVNIVFGDLLFNSIGNSDNDLSIGYKEFVDRFVEAKKYSEELGVFYSTMFASNFDEKVKYACRSCLPTPHLTVDGYVTCCDMCVNGDSPLKDLIYGFYDEKNNKIVYDNNSIDKIRLRYPDNIEKCRSCDIKDYCGGACLGEAYNETGDFFGVKQEACEAIKYLWYKLGGHTIELPYLHP